MQCITVYIASIPHATCIPSHNSRYPIVSMKDIDSVIIVIHQLVRTPEDSVQESRSITPLSLRICSHVGSWRCCIRCREARKITKGRSHSCGILYHRSILLTNIWQYRTHEASLMKCPLHQKCRSQVRFQRLGWIYKEPIDLPI